ncbi:MAG: hypothetical protein U1E70_22760 [Acetobacteraceae bacterium]
MIQSLRTAGRLAEAATACSEGEELFIDDARFLIEHARVARAANRQELAISKWQAVHEGFPTLNTGYIGEANLRFELGERLECLAIIRTAVERFPNDVAIWSTAARLEGRYGDLDARWPLGAGVALKFPNGVDGWIR